MSENIPNAIEEISEADWSQTPESVKQSAEQFIIAFSSFNAIVSVMDDPSNLDLYQQANLPHL